MESGATPICRGLRQAGARRSCWDGGLSPGDLASQREGDACGSRLDGPSWGIMILGGPLERTRSVMSKPRHGIPNPAAPAIVCRGLTKDYGRGRGLFDLDLDISRGEIFGFIGPNGAGKTVRSSASEPILTKRPSRIRPIRSQPSSTSVSTCEDRRTVAPPATASSTMRQNSRCISGSKPSVGSSRIRTSGACMNAAEAMRPLRWPQVARLGGPVLGVRLVRQPLHRVADCDRHRSVGGVGRRRRRAGDAGCRKNP